MKQSYRKINLIYGFFQGSKGYFILAVVASFVTTLLNALTPQIFRFGIDEVLSGNSRFSDKLWVLALLIVLVAVAAGVFTYISRTNVTRAGENFAKNLADALFTHVQKLPMKWHDKHQTGDIIQRCTSDVEVIRRFVVTQLLEVCRTTFLVITSFAIMFSMNVKLSCIVLLFVPVVVTYSTVFYKLIAKRFTSADEAEGELSTVVQENATGVRVVRAFGREKFEMDRFQEKNDAFAKLWIRLGGLSGLYWGVGDLITGLMVVTVIVFGVLEAVSGQLTVGEFIAFATYNTTLVWPIRGLGRILSDMSKAGVSFERVDYIIRSQEEEYEKKGTVWEERYDITFEHVSYGYEEGKEVLQDISFTIPEGKTFGILGGTGSGKSTVIQLLSRLYETEKGSIRIGGRDVKEIPLEELRRNVGMVLQEPFLYSRTIGENIAASVPEATMEEIRYAAQIACIDNSIMDFPDGYETLVGERGVTLSGGQKQRIAIARMLLQKAPIMVFDDSLSAVDSQTDFHIRQALKEHMKHATVILISHRVTTLMGADEILVLNQGKVEERGTHEKLIQGKGIYRRIYEIQMSHDDRERMEG